MTVDREQDGSEDWALSYTFYDLKKGGTDSIPPNRLHPNCQIMGKPRSSLFVDASLKENFQAETLIHSVKCLK